MSDGYEETVEFGDERWQIVVTNDGSQIKIRPHVKGAMLSVPLIIPHQAVVGVYKALGRAIQAMGDK